MSKAKKQKIDRHTTLSCISVPEDRIEDKKKNKIIASLQRNGWGVVAEQERYRFLHFNKQTHSDVLQILDKLDCNEEGWCVYDLSFHNAEDVQNIVDSAEWK
ncbi:MAG: hypothetical protein JXM70_19430 [Pirellulales bacterium]|nr:hypothetical protein [Pirellulales bacterium]